MKFVSFDIFDTCISRTCGDATGVFYLLAQRILGADVAVSYCAEFVQERKRAEQTARQKAQKEEITIEDIYVEADFSAFCSIPNAEILKEEIKIEEEVWQPIQQTIHLIQRLRQEGEKIVFVSDMYLPQLVIKEALTRMGIFVEEDCIYVSSEYGITKQSGKLFDYIRLERGIDVNQWKHYGDNRHSDYDVPRSKGITAHWQRYDYQVVEPLYLKQMNLGEYPCASVLAGLTRSMRLTTNTEVGTFAYSLAAPLFVSWTLRIMRDATERGIKRLCFLARDGYIPYLIAQEYASLFPKIECSFVYVSRKSLYLLGEKDLSYKAIEKMLQKNIGQTVGYALDVWNINDWLELPEQLASTKITANNLSAIMQECQKRHLSEDLQDMQVKGKETTMLYFEQEHLTEPNTAVVDIRGTRTSHRRINDLLVQYGHAPVFAYYLEVFDKRCTMEAGEYRAEIYDEMLSAKTRQLFMSQPDMIEQVYAITPFARTIGYDVSQGVANPHFEKQPKGDMVGQTQEYIQDIMLFAKAYKTVGLTAYADKVLALSLESLLETLRKPSREILKYLTQVSISETDVDKQYYIHKYTQKDWLRVLVCSKNLSKVVWFEGDIWYNMPSVAERYIRYYRWCRSIIHRLRHGS